MFVDEAKVSVRAGAGGNGASTFRREKYVPRGGPDGGDGGSGGSVYLVTDAALTTLLDFRYRHLFKAGHGDHGSRSNKHCKQSPDLLLPVPVGTLVRNSATGEVIGDLVADGQRLLVAAGGRGGRGNAQFATPTNRAPRFAENGEPGEVAEIILELKVMADVGLLGLPNAGKSSLLDRISAAHPKIGDYPFTTLVPILGVVSLGDHRSCVVADIPGLIEGAHSGAGLGHQFLRHIERTRMLVHVLDCAVDSPDEAMQNFEVVTEELRQHNPALTRLPLIVALNKTDIADPSLPLSLVSLFKDRDLEAFPISAATGSGIEALLYRVSQLLQAGATAPGILSQTAPDRVEIGPPRSRRPSRVWSVTAEADGAWRVTGEGLERLVAMTNVDNDKALERLDRVLDRHGILAALKRAGVEQGATVHIGSTEFVFVEEDNLYQPRRRGVKT